MLRRVNSKAKSRHHLLGFHTSMMREEAMLYAETHRPNTYCNYDPGAVLRMP